jgi:hypothetical protein
MPRQRHADATPTPRQRHAKRHANATPTPRTAAKHARREHAHRSYGVEGSERHIDAQVRYPLFFYYYYYNCSPTFFFYCCSPTSRPYANWAGAAPTTNGRSVRGEPTAASSTTRPWRISSASRWSPSSR